MICAYLCLHASHPFVLFIICLTYIIPSIAIISFQSAYEAERLDRWNRESTIEARRIIEEEYCREQEYRRSAHWTTLKQRRHDERSAAAREFRLIELEMERELYLSEIRNRRASDAILARGRDAVESLIAARTAAAKAGRSGAAAEALQAAEEEAQRADDKRREMERSAEAQRIALEDAARYYQDDRGFIELAKLQYQLCAIEEEDGGDDDGEEDEDEDAMDGMCQMF